MGIMYCALLRVVSEAPAVELKKYYAIFFSMSMGYPTDLREIINPNGALGIFSIGQQEKV